VSLPKLLRLRAIRFGLGIFGSGCPPDFLKAVGCDVVVDLPADASFRITGVLSEDETEVPC
jgi:hypothetical protein